MAVHYIWYDGLYFDEADSKKNARLLRRLEKGKLEPNIYLLALPESREHNILDIYSTLELMQPHYKDMDKYIVGIAHGRQKAIELAASIVEEMYNSKKDFDIRDFLNFHEKEDGLANIFSGKEV